MFEKAYQLGYQTPETQELVIGYFQSAIEDVSQENHTTYNPTTIKTNINNIQKYLERIEELDPQNAFIQKYSEWLHPQAYNPDDYTEADLSAEEITNLINVMDRWISFNEGNTYYSELYKKYPNNPITMIMLGTYEYYNENYLDAVGLLSAAVEIEPGIGNAWEFLGFAFQEIGAMEHAREAYIQCLRLNIGNTAAYYRLSELHAFLRWWPEDFFEDYGFGMYYNGTALLSIVSETASEEAGIAQSEDDFIFFRLTWQTETGVDLTEEHLREMMVSTVDANSPRFRSDFMPYYFGEVPMIYRNFSYKIIGSPDWADGVVVGWYSEGITYIMELRFVEDGYDHDYLNWLMAIYIETFTHRLDTAAELWL